MIAGALTFLIQTLGNLFVVALLLRFMMLGLEKVSGPPAMMIGSCSRRSAASSGMPAPSSRRMTPVISSS